MRLPNAVARLRLPIILDRGKPCPYDAIIMKYDPNKHHRRSIRLKGYDYRNAGAYFVTICTQNRECVLNDPIVNGIIYDVWLALPSWFPTIALDEFVVMPNHTHFVVWNTVGATLAVAQNAITQNVAAQQTSTPPDGHIPKFRIGAGSGRTGASLVPTTWAIPKPEKINVTPTLGDVVGAFKSLVFKVYLDLVEIHDPARRAKFWQRNYYEHIIRNERELNAIRQYIIDNPENWKMDRDNRENLRKLPYPEKVEDYLQDVYEMFNIQRRSTLKEKR